MTINQDLLNNYFSQVWYKRDRDLSKYHFSGYSLVDKVKPDEWVLDVGCGKHPFKGHIQNLVGIDPAFDEADHRVTIQDFETDQKFDVAFCLGSINFGDDDDIRAEIAKVVSLLTPESRIYWRCNPGRADHGNAECNFIPFYDWTMERLVYWAEEFGFKVTEIRWDSNNRIYAEWVKRTAT